jgi:CPA2 family monovalent cation:H+ antiporter-2
MPHETELIATIVMGLVVAFVGGFAATKVRLPPLVGYLLAGVAIGPFTPGFVGDQHLADQLAEIGVILLMFGVGLHFSIGDLLAVRKIAVPGALGQIAVATALGAGIAWLWGWTFGAGLVFGLALSVASTVVLLRALEERGVLDSGAGRIAVGWLIVEDLAMVLALVLLPALAGLLGGDPRGFAGQAGGGSLWLTLALTLAKVALFLALVLVVGQRVIPWILAQVARTGSRELFTLAVLAIALGIAYGSAELFGVSFALGAFFAGVVLAETDFSQRAAADSLPLQDAFAVLFFVSVGMLFDPSIVWREPLATLTVLGVILFAKTLAAFAIVMAFGYQLRTALLVSASLAQIGEFSFILAGLGVQLGLLPTEGRDLILAGAILSIMANPAVFAATGWLGTRFEARAGTPGSAPDELGAPMPVQEDGAEIPSAGHAIVVGWGRVGRIVVEGLQSMDVPTVVIEQDRQRATELRAAGIPVVHGQAAGPEVLEHAHAATAKVLVLAAPESYHTQAIIEHARRLNPEIEVAVRANTESEVATLAKQGVGLAIMGEREVAYGLMDYALRRLGTSANATQVFIQTMRGTGEGGAFERRPEELARGTPELRAHREPEEQAG